MNVCACMCLCSFFSSVFLCLYNFSEFLDKVKRYWFLFHNMTGVHNKNIKRTLVFTIIDISYINIIKFSLFKKKINYHVSHGRFVKVNFYFNFSISSDISCKRVIFSPKALLCLKINMQMLSRP